MEQWEKNFYISAIAGANNGSSLVVMSKGRDLVPDEPVVLMSRSCGSALMKCLV